MSDERRQFQRLHLTDPVDAWFGDYAVRLLNVSATGALIESDEPLPDEARGLLRFYWRGAEIELLAKTARQLAVKTGLEFLEESDALCALIAASATELLLAQEANAAGNREANFIGDQTLTAASTAARPLGFVTWTLGDDGDWKAHRSLLRDQPPNGFTIPAGEPEDQVALLCKTYESGDTESRRLTRMLAEISVAGSG
ncbi:MAG TPA: PilZ domain-containing protein [Thermoanaerobaculia bacterium]|nr:PilZ domain-containing protein [Thermoanaerobaculia bacterium]